MKRVFLLLLAIVLLASLTACAHTQDDTSSAANSDAGAAYVGEWKANTLAGLIDGVKTYTVSVIELQRDGSGTYKGRDLTWEYSKEANAINFTIIQENVSAALQIQEINGNTVLKFYDDVYYRAEEFEAIDE